MSDDEFDDLFSFSTATTPKAAKGSGPSSSSDDFNLDKDGSNHSIDLDTTLKDFTTSTSVSAHTSDSGSYQKVEDPISSVSTLPSTKGEDEDQEEEDDIFGDFDLGLPKQAQDDFDEVDEGTREFLDFLEDGGGASISKGTSQDETINASNILDQSKDEKDDDEEMLDFVDLDASPTELKSTSKNNQDKRINASGSQGTRSEDESERMKKSLEKTKTVELDPNTTATVLTLPPSSPKNTVTTTPEATPTLAAVPRQGQASASSQYQSNAILTSDSADSEGNAHRQSFKSQDFDDVDDLTFESNLKSSSSTSTLPLPKVAKEITFNSLGDAIRSPVSTMDQHIFPLLYPNGKHSDFVPNITSDDRKWLWTKTICSKLMTDVQSSSLADSFVNWDGVFNMEDFESGKRLYGLEKDFVRNLLVEIDILADRAVETGCGVKDVTKRNLALLLLFHYRNNSSIPSDETLDATNTSVNDDLVTEDREVDAETNSKVSEQADEVGNQKDATAEIKGIDGSTSSEIEVHEAPDETQYKNDNEIGLGGSRKTTTESSSIEWNALLGPVAVTLLSVSVPVSVASVMLSNLLPVAMPLVSLTNIERTSAAKTLHLQFYFLVCYHLPLLVLHLDRYAPGWHWPMEVDTDLLEGREKADNMDSPTEKCRNLEAHGSIGITWFTSHLAGDSASYMQIEPKTLLTIWDVLLTSDDPSLRFFLALAVMEKNSDALLMLRGEELIAHVRAIMALKNANLSMFEEDPTSDNISKSNASVFMRSWCHHARTIRDSTPASIVNDLCKAEDKALDQALMVRSKLAMEKVKSRLEIEAEEHRRAIEVRNALEEEQFIHQYYQIRLQNFYKKHCPEKLAKIDKILKVYKGRYYDLDTNLKLKYKAGFLPAISILNPKLSSKTSNLLSSMGHEIQKKRKQRRALQTENKLKKLADELMESLNKHLVAPKVSANEILPIVCGVQSMKPTGREGLKYYLVDSRPEETVKLQGGFPTAVKLSPEDLMDPDKIQEKLDMFEALRGAAHICVMGEGFSSFPKLFGHNLSAKEEKLLDDDDSRTNICALFFIKKGFPFVSVLDGGFAAAHTWLARDCPNLPMSSILVDYDEDESLLSTLESSYQRQQEFSNASTRRKTTLALQKLIDNSMTRLTMSENRIEDFTERLRSEEGRKQVKHSVTKIFATKNVDNANSGEDSSSSQVNSNNANNVNVGDSKSFRMSFNGLMRRKEASSTSIDDAKRDKVVGGKGSRMTTFNSFRKDNSKDQATNVEGELPPRNQNNFFSRIKNHDGVNERIDDEDPKLTQPPSRKPNNIFNRNKIDQGNKDKKAFDIGKISFFPNRAERKEEDDLVKEIEASMRMPPQEHEKLQSASEKKKQNLGDSVKKSVTSIKTSMNRIPVKKSVSSIKTSFGNIPFKKMGTMTMRKSGVENEAEEESIMFEDSVPESDIKVGEVVAPSDDVDNLAIGAKIHEENK